jgi:hypothetical protein
MLLRTHQFKKESAINSSLGEVEEQEDSLVLVEVVAQGETLEVEVAYQVASVVLAVVVDDPEEVEAWVVVEDWEVVQGVS